ncbi:hypothetical protein [Streptomyces anulatus]
MTTVLFPDFELRAPGPCATGRLHESRPHARSPEMSTTTFALVPVMRAAL